MVGPRHFKSRTMRKVFVKTPGGRTVVHYKLKKPSQARCAICKKPLKGIPRLRPYKAHNTAKSKKKVARKYGGYLCSKCARERIREEAKLK